MFQGIRRESTLTTSRIDSFLEACSIAITVGALFDSLKLLLRNIVHRQMIHVRLNELKGLILDHLDRLLTHNCLEALHLFSGDALPIFGRLKCFLEDALDILHALDALSHAQAEVAEPLVVECDRPVLAQELHNVGDYIRGVS